MQFMSVIQDKSHYKWKYFNLISMYIIIVIRGKIKLSSMSDKKLNSHSFHFDPPPLPKNWIWRMLKLTDLQV
jgi:hypothetical protein